VAAGGLHLTILKQVDVDGVSMGYYSRITGERLEFASADERRKSRLARMRKVVWVAICGLRDAQDAQGGALHMYTLTYKGTGDWEPRHISNMVRWLRGHGVELSVWVAELQRRGAVHYHLLALHPNGVKWVKPTSDAGGWTRGFTWVTPNVEKPFYLMKYLQKGGKDGRSVSFPKGLRLYGVSRKLISGLQFGLSTTYRECQLPRWFWQDAGDDCVVRIGVRACGGVSVGGLTAFSPYAVGDVPCIDEVAARMYTNAWGLGLPLPS